MVFRIKILKRRKKKQVLLLFNVRQKFITLLVFLSYVACWLIYYERTICPFWPYINICNNNKTLKDKILISLFIIYFFILFFYFYLFIHYFYLTNKFMFFDFNGNPLRISKFNQIISIKDKSFPLNYHLESIFCLVYAWSIHLINFIHIKRIFFFFVFDKMFWLNNIKGNRIKFISFDSWGREYRFICDF